MRGKGQGAWFAKKRVSVRFDFNVFFPVRQNSCRTVGHCLSRTYVGPQRKGSGETSDIGAWSSSQR